MYRYANRFKLLGIICFFIACKPMPKPNFSSTKDLDQTLVNTPEPTEAECLQYHNMWSQFHPKGIASPTIAVVDLTGNPVKFDQLKVWLSFCPLSAAQTGVMRSMHSTFHHRMMHLAWHQIRSRWNSSSFASIQQRITSEFPELSLSEDNLESGSLYGVDFLWMHGTMFHELNERLKFAGLPPIVGWKVLPRSTSRLFPPRETDEESWQSLSDWEVLYQSDTFIAGTLTLGDYGKIIESTIHNLMHGYYAAARRYRLNMPLLATESEISETDLLHMQYDPKRPEDLEDYLSSPIGSAVNPTFWKLHGWIDDRIQDYLTHLIHDSLTKKG